LIAQQDHPNTDLATLFQSIGVVDLDALVKTLITEGQHLPVLPEEFIFHKWYKVSWL
jgi:hypothetical protein